MVTPQNVNSRFDEEIESLQLIKKKAASLFELSETAIKEANKAYTRRQFEDYRILLENYSEIKKKQTEIANHLMDFIDTRLSL